MLASRNNGVFPMRARMESTARVEENCVLGVVEAIGFAANIPGLDALACRTDIYVLDVYRIVRGASSGKMDG